MAKPVYARGVALGEGRPKICVPLVAKTRRKLLYEAMLAKDTPADLVEWRVDHFDGAGDLTEVKSTLEELRGALGELPLLFTFRTAREGGSREIAQDYYRQLMAEAVVSGLADLLDVELLLGDALCREMIEAAHQNGVAVVLSNHDFERTPPKEVLLERLERMLLLGADLPKIAAMPQTAGDVLTMLDATWEMTRRHPGCPVITVSMGELGVVSRVSGAFFGSVMSFGALEQASAPGQLAAAKLHTVLEILEGSQKRKG